MIMLHLVYPKGCGVTTCILSPYILFYCTLFAFLVFSNMYRYAAMKQNSKGPRTMSKVPTRRLLPSCVFTSINTNYLEMPG